MAKVKAAEIILKAVTTLIAVAMAIIKFIGKIKPAIA